MALPADITMRSFNIMRRTVRSISKLLGESGKVFVL